MSNSKLLKSILAHNDAYDKAFDRNRELLEIMRTEAMERRNNFLTIAHELAEAGKKSGGYLRLIVTEELEIMAIDRIICTFYARSEK